MNDQTPGPAPAATAPAAAPAPGRPPAAPAATTPWARPAAGATPWAKQAGPAKPRATERLRKTIDGLPGWEPLPPGEILIRRGGRHG